MGSHLPNTENRRMRVNSPLCSVQGVLFGRHSARAVGRHCNAPSTIQSIRFISMLRNAFHK